MVRGLLADLDDAPEEGVLVGRVGAVPLDDGVDPAVLGEIHCCCRRDRGPGRYGCRFIRRKFVWALLCSLFALAVIAAQAQMFYVGFKNCLTVDIGLNLMKV